MTAATATPTSPTAGTAATSDRRTLRVEECMGTVFTIDIRDPGHWAAAVDEVVDWLHHVDEVFSTYKDTSDISRIRRGDLTVEGADPDVGPVLAMCAQLETETGGRFSAYYDGTLDPTGLVKGWAIERASALLRTRGSANHAVNGGGDIQIAGEAAPGSPWVVGISDPFDRSRVLTTVSGRDFAIATSGTGERGSHIIHPLTRQAVPGLTSVTITGRRLSRVDAYATAAVAMGPQALGWIAQQPGHEGFVVTADHRITMTAGFHRPAGPPPLVRRTPPAEPPRTRWRRAPSAR